MEDLRDVIKLNKYKCDIDTTQVTSLAADYRLHTSIRAATPSRVVGLAPKRSHHYDYWDYYNRPSSFDKRHFDSHARSTSRAKSVGRQPQPYYQSSGEHYDQHGGQSISRAKSVGRQHQSSYDYQSGERRSHYDNREQREPRSRYDNREQRHRYQSQSYVHENDNVRTSSTYSRRPKKYSSSDHRHTSSSHKSQQKKHELFLAANKNAIGMLVGNEYEIFDIKKTDEKEYVKSKSPWVLRMAMFDERKNKCVSKVVIHRYAASKTFILNVLNRFLKEECDKCHTTTNTIKFFKKRFTKVIGFEKLFERINNMDKNKRFHTCITKPQRRSTVCLFRPGCKKRNECVYCELEALNNSVNLVSGLRATRDQNVSENDRGVLDMVVSDVASITGARARSVSSSSSSSGSSSSSVATSSDSENKDDKKRKCSSSKVRRRLRRKSRGSDKNERSKKEYTGADKQLQHTDDNTQPVPIATVTTDDTIIDVDKPPLTPGRTLENEIVCSTVNTGLTNTSISSSSSSSSSSSDEEDSVAEKDTWRKRTFQTTAR